MSVAPRPRVIAVVLALLGAATAPAPASLLDGVDTTGRSDETVVVAAAVLAPLIGQPVDDLALFRYEASTGLFSPIPFQVDQRLLRVFDQGLPTQFSEMVYDVLGEDDGLLDADDEVAFLMADGGDRAPIVGSWIPGADPLRIEIAVDDPLGLGTLEDRWVYLFTGSGLPQSTASHVSWDGRPDTSITTEVFRLDFDGNWVMTGLTVFGPCGSGSDLIDRFKGRVEPGVGELRQDEEDWSANSTYLGGLQGPVRAIRYVRGARSGVNTIHHDIVERSGWKRRINLRVHPVDSVWIYFDWLPSGSTVLYTPNETGGVMVDGVPDAGVTSAYTEWHLMNSSAGGLFLAWDVPISPLYAARELYYLDDASHDDTVPNKSSSAYPDDDDSAYGAHGVKITGALDSNVTPIRLNFDAVPLCGNQGSPGLATELKEKVETPLQPNAIPQSDCGAIRSLDVRLDGQDVVLDWQATPAADAYRVYASDLPDQPRAFWTVLAEGPELSYRDTGAATGSRRFYSVVCTRQGGEGPW